MKTLLVEVGRIITDNEFTVVNLSANKKNLSVQELKTGEVVITKQGAKPKKYQNWGYAMSKSSSIIKAVLESASEVVERHRKYKVASLSDC